MKIILVCLLAVALADDPLREVLKSPRATLNLYSQFKAKNHLKFSTGEDVMRFRLFRANAEHVADYNEDTEDSAGYALNKFSAMTPGEKQRYLGLNITSMTPGPEDTVLRSGVGNPSKLLWTDKGKVTPVKDQGSCGSCWSFGAVGGLETTYAVKSGVLRNFAEQEWLDCVFEGKDDGCDGGWVDRCYQWSAQYGGRLAATKDYPYTEKDGRCYYKQKPNAMKAYKMTGAARVSQSEAAHIDVLQSASIGVAFEVTDRTFQYDHEILRDTTCRGHANHAVSMVGYAPKYVLVKNSWGTNWGDKGFVRFARGYHNCQLFKYSSYPRLVSTGASDSGSDSAVNYTPPDDDGNNPDPSPNPDPNCKDVNSDCAKWKSYCASNGWVDYMKKYCAKTCNYCEGGDGGDCPRGTVRCSDGVCRHEHMC